VRVYQFELSVSIPAGEPVQTESERKNVLDALQNRVKAWKND
jgi:hypothetical protein